MNEPLDKRLQMYMVSKAVNWMPFGPVWDSSAKKLEDALRARGIKLPKKLYYEYRLPGGMKPSALMNKLVMQYFVTNFFSSFAGRVLADKKLSMSDKAKIFKYVWNKRSEYKNLIEQYEKQIRMDNPELANLKTKNATDFVYGVTFGFAPAELEYFANPENRDSNAENKVYNTLKRYGITPGYVLAPDTAKMVIAALKQKALEQKARSSNIKEI